MAIQNRPQADERPSEISSLVDLLRKQEPSRYAQWSTADGRWKITVLIIHLMDGSKFSHPAVASGGCQARSPAELFEASKPMFSKRPKPHERAREISGLAPQKYNVLH
jgi:hypothetical protein